jgi:peptide-methionine (S)-S-oxide reductase
MVRIGFGGGCHWCTEAVFSALRGVSEISQGYIRSEPPDDSYSEAVIVTFNPCEIDLATLIEVHLRTHASTSDHKMRGKYRSAVYAFNKAQSANAKGEIARLQPVFDAPIVTKVLPFSSFKLSDERFQNYYRNDPSRPFCTTYIDPKLKLIRQRFAHKVRTDTESQQEISST